MKYFGEQNISLGSQAAWAPGGNILSYSSSNMRVNTITRPRNGGGGTGIIHILEGGPRKCSARLRGEIF